MNVYIYQVEDLRNELVPNVHVSRLIFYHCRSLDKTEIWSYVLNSETGMLVQRLMSLLDTDNGLIVQICWVDFLIWRKHLSHWKILRRCPTVISKPSTSKNMPK